MILAPLVVRGVLRETLWGGQHLATVAGKQLPPGARIGESWETSVESPVVTPPFAGMTLGDVTATLGMRLYGARAREVCGERFPLLVKFLDAHAWLSVQVHPDDAYAAEHEGGQLGKTEAWRILRAEPEATVLHGVSRPTSRAEIAHAIAAQRLDDLACRVPVHAGDVLLNRAGTLHATGAGIVLYEIQEYSDLTYRLYDFGRVGADGQPRPLHIDRALDVLSYDPPARHTSQPLAHPDDPRQRLLVACRHFALAEMRLTDAFPLTRATDGTSCHIVTAIEGRARLTWGTVREPRGLTLDLGATAIVPAEALTYSLAADAEDGMRPATALIAWVPPEGDPWVAAWQRAQVAGG